ncbi:MAG: flagellar hook capping protein [Roseburia sp.]|nr:flagellar hook capping protein [Roseburia sp.]
MALIQPVENGKIPTTEEEEKTTSAGNDLGYDEFLQLLCAEMQYQDPLEPTSNTEYVAQLATFSQMESMLNMQNSIESSKANDLVGKYVIVKTTSPTTGDTEAVAGFVDYVEYENNQKYLYINGTRYSLDDVYQVADTEYMEAISLAEAFAASVAKFPDADELTLAYQEDFSNLYAVYDSLTTYQKTYIDEETMTKFEQLDGTMAGLVFGSTVLSLPEVDELTLNDKTGVESLRKYYESLTTFEKGYISEDHYNKLVALESKLAELDKESGATE